jgi:MSHA biogenesis protein MshE
MTRPQKLRLGEILLAQGLLTDKKLTEALQIQKQSGRKLGRIFVENGYVTEDQVAQAVAKQLNIPCIAVRLAALQPEVVRLLTEAQARRFRAVVLEDRKQSLLVGFADPTDLFAYDEVARTLKREIDVALVKEGELLEAIDHIYQRTEEIKDHAKELTAEVGDSVIDLGAMVETPGLAEAPVVKLLLSVFEAASRNRASDIHIEPQERSLAIRFRIDGVLHMQTEADPKIASAVVLRLKLMSGLDISEKRLPQDGRFEMKMRNSVIDVRISTLPTQYGESVAMRLLSHQVGLLNLDRLGMPAHILARLRHAIQRPSGMVLVTGPTGSGKTTTLYAALSELNTVKKKIITVEDPVEYRLAGINQVQVYEKIDLSFERVLRSALRQDPDIVLVGEMRDRSTAEIGLRAAMTGHMVLSTLHTNDAASTPVRLRDMDIPSYMIAVSLRLVLAQRLVRVICPDCIRPAELDPQEHAWMRSELGDEVGGIQYKRGAGCGNCNDTGFRGRTGIYEMLEMTMPVAEAAHQEDPASFARAAREQMGSYTLRRGAARLVAEGRTTVEEAMMIDSEI